MINTQSLRYRMTVLHTALLAGSLALLCASVYLGVRSYLDADVRGFLSGQCHAIGEKLLAHVNRMGESDVIEELNEHYAPEVIGEFIRISRADGSVVYQSSPPNSAGVGPGVIFPVRGTLARETFRRFHHPGGGEVVVNEYPYWTSDGRYYLVEVGSPYRSTASVLYLLGVHLALVAVVIVLGALLGGAWLTNHALLPVNSITQRAEQISHSTLRERLPVIHSGDEIERLSVALNRMIQRLEDAFRHVDQFSADVSHELRTPLSILQSDLEEMMSRPLTPELREMTASALEETGRLTRIIHHLLELSRIDGGISPGKRAALDLGNLAVSTAEQMKLLAEEQGVTLVSEIERDVEVEGDPVRLRQLVANLLDNAVKYTPAGGAVRMAVRGAGDRALMQIADTGAGIPASALPHIFDRFYRADWARTRNTGGAGLGLSIAKAICAAHQAQITVDSVEGEGSCFVVEFARVRSSARETKPGTQERDFVLEGSPSLRNDKA